MIALVEKHIFLNVDLIHLQISNARVRLQHTGVTVLHPNFSDIAS